MLKKQKQVLEEHGQIKFPANEKAELAKKLIPKYPEFNMQTFRDEWDLQETKKRNPSPSNPIGKEEEKRVLAQRQLEEGGISTTRKSIGSPNYLENKMSKFLLFEKIIRWDLDQQWN